MSGRLLLLGSLAYGLLLAGLLTFNGSLLALAIPLVLYLGAALWYGPQKFHLSVTRTISAEVVSPGQPVTVRVMIANHGPRLEQVHVQDVVPASLEQVEGHCAVLTTVAAGGTIELEYIVRGRRGTHTWRETRLAASDALGLFSRRGALPAETRLMILPQWSKLRPVDIRPPRTRDFPGPIPARQGGAGVNFFGVREYQVGDPLRRINWRLTARTQLLYSNEFEQERIADVGVILDARQQSDVQLPDGSLFEESVRAAAALSEVFLRAGNRVGLLIYGSGIERVFPGYGKVQRWRILRALAGASTGVNYALENLDYLPTRFFPPRSQIVVISPVNPNDVRVLTRLKACGYQVLVVSPDPIEFETRLAPPGKTMDMAVRIARVERKLLLSRLRRVGIQVVDWRVTQSLDMALHTALAGTRPSDAIRAMV